MLLSREGIFPLDGGSTGLRGPGTVQGEGLLCGVPSLFVRLQGCNLACHWRLPDGRLCRCDTSHAMRKEEGTGNKEQGQGGKEEGTGNKELLPGVQELSPAAIVSAIIGVRGALGHVVVTGGEPYLQSDELVELLALLREAGLHSTVESNGTVCRPDVAAATDLTSLSPKLPSSGIPAELLEASRQATPRLVEAALAHGHDAQLKFVVATPADADDILALHGAALSLLPADHVMVMPLGATADELRQTTRPALQMALDKGWRLATRLHVQLFGNTEGT